ncbi:hypothetical protein ATY41_01330 [Leifsonia xyli subsp. xyli]|nr:DUF3027 domain-containing protein [Leifsonia xyli]ODA91352.1 hypothetical protein ATY41_01330 [Leifsonia xyli subsp. xyli]
MPESPAEPGDFRELVAAISLARAALAEITPESTVGEPLGHVVEAGGAVSLLFACTLPGYPGWRWTVSVGRAEDGVQPTVLEAELMPGEESLLAPDWVPWSERLAEYQAAQEALTVEADDDDEDGEDRPDEDEDEDEDSDGFDDEDDHDIHDLHAGDDVDGVDIDSVGGETGLLPTGVDDEATDIEADAEPVLPDGEGAVL